MLTCALTHLQLFFCFQDRAVSYLSLLRCDVSWWGCGLTSPVSPLQVELAEFSSFNYWRAPIADVDALLADLNLLL